MLLTDHRHTQRIGPAPGAPAHDRALSDRSTRAPGDTPV